MGSVVVHAILARAVSTPSHHRWSWRRRAAISLSALVKGGAVLAIWVFGASVSDSSHARSGASCEWPIREFAAGRRGRADSGPCSACHERKLLSSRRIQLAELDAILLLLTQNVLLLRRLPARHWRKSIFADGVARLPNVELRKLRGFIAGFRSQTATHHGRVRLVALVGVEGTRLVEMFVRCILASVAAAAAAITALEEGKAGAAAGHAAARTSDYAPQDREHDERSNNDRDNDGPPETGR